MEEQSRTFAGVVCDHDDLIRLLDDVIGTHDIWMLQLLASGFENL